ncbi:MAG: response regulator transcription factor [Cyclobacteriaceae bacterium]
MTRISLLEENSLYRSTLAHQINQADSEYDLHSFQEASSFLLAFRPGKFSVCIIDLDMSTASGKEVIKKVRLVAPEQRFLATSIFFDEVLHRELREMGVSGVLVKSDKQLRIESALKQMMDGLSAYPEKFCFRDTASLSRRALEIQKLFRMGNDLSSISDQLGVDQITVKMYLKGLSAI